MTATALAVPILLSLYGCGDQRQRREGLGGGAIAPVRVTLLTEGVDVTDPDVVDVDAPKITEFGNFRGRVVVVGESPSLRPVVAEGQAVPDAAVCARMPVPNESVVVGPDNGLANVFVYLRRVPNVDIPDPPEEPVLFDQKDCRFVPRAFVCQVGQPIRIVNSDPVAHNVGISGTAMSFNQTLGANDQRGLELRYERAEPLPVGTRCDFHGWMRAYQLALDHPWGAVTAEDGSFEIEGVPAGEMEFVVWHETAGYVERRFRITISADETVEQTLEVDAGRLQ